MRLTNSQLSEATTRVHGEINSAINKHGDRTIDQCEPLDKRLRILVEEVGEVAEAIQRIDDRDGHWERQHLAKEIAQVAACCMMWLARIVADEDAASAVKP